jgi:hypothetical protein
MDVEVKYKSPVADWPEAFGVEWLIMKASPSAAQCLVAARHNLVATGKSVLNYVAWGMEGYLPEEVEQWRVLYVQTYITGVVKRACNRLQCMINTGLV